MAALDTSRSLLAARALSILRVELKVTEMGEQLHRFRKRIAVSRFFDLYELLQANPSLILPRDPETMGEPSSDVTSKQASRLSSQVLNRVADLMFLNTAHVKESLATASSAAGRVHEERHRKAALRKIQDWRRNGKPWSAMIRRFGIGVLLLLPKSLSDENLRTTMAATFEELLNVMESMLSHSKVLLRSATALSGSLIQCQAPPETLRLEIDSTLLDTDEECSQDLNALLEPCGLVAPRQNCRKDTMQAEESSSNLAVGPSLSEYNSDHLYSDDSYETRATTPPPQWPIGLGINLLDSEEEEEDEACRPTPPLEDSKFYRESTAFPAMDYNQSYLRQPGMKHPYAPSPVPTPRKASVSFAQDHPRAKRPSNQHHHQPQKQSFNPTTYPYPSPPSTPESLHKPRPASSVYPADECPSLSDFPFPPPPIPQAYASRPNQRSSSVSPKVVSKAALARSEMMSPRSYSSSLVSVSTEGGKKALNRRSSWYDFWKPVFEKPASEKSP